jgi:drug/metabolite transporter superfamily protein YnfA
MRTVILGLGNLLLADEGVGVHAAHILMERGCPDDTVVPDIGTAILDALAVIIGVYGLVTWLTRHSIRRGWSVRADLLLQVAVVLAVAGAAWLLGGNTYPDGGGVYRHFFVVFVPITGLAMVIAGFLSPMIWSNACHNSNYRNTLDKTELFCRREQGLPVVVDEPTTRLEVAAALNANFPPGLLQRGRRCRWKSAVLDNRRRNR